MYDLPGYRKKEDKIYQNFDKDDGEGIGKGNVPKRLQTSPYLLSLNDRSDTFSYKTSFDFTITN